MKYTNCYVNFDEKELVNVKDSFNYPVSGKGMYVELFESKLCEKFGSNYSLTCANATLGIKMILDILNVKSGDEVMLPCTAPIMCVLPILEMGAIPVFVDTEVDSFSVCLDDLSNKRSYKSRLFINVPMWGFANNVIELVTECKALGIPVLEDNSHCHGTKIGDQYLGVFGDFAVFSTHERKLITTGEGAFLLVKDKENYTKLKELRSFGELSDNSDLPNVSMGSYGYRFGMNYKMSSINASIGVAQLEKLEDKIAVRTANAEILRKLMLEIDGITEIKQLENSFANYYSIVFMIDKFRKPNLEKFLFENDVVSDPFRYNYCPLYKFQIVEKFSDSKCPKSEELISQVFTLPVHEGLNESDMVYLVDLVKKHLNG